MTKTIANYPMLAVRSTENDIMWIFTGAYSLIDNFAPTPVTIDIGHGEQEYLTSEHAFAAAKAGADKGWHDAIAALENTGSAKAMGRRAPLRADWEDVKFDIMWDILVAKFAQREDARRVLLLTGNRTIYEGNTWNDQIWGVTKDRPTNIWHGRNALGAMLMELRTLWGAA